MSGLPGWITIKHASKRLGITVQAVHHLVKRGRMRFRWIGDRIMLVNEDDVTEYGLVREQRRIPGEAS